MKTFTLAMSALILMMCVANSVWAHNDVRPYVQGGKIQTAGWDDATSIEVPNMRVFGYDFGEDLDQPFFTQDPGFNAASGSGLTPGSQLSFNIVGAGGLGLPANLSYWDGSGEVDFTPTPSGETLTLNFGTNNRTVGSSTSFMAGFNLQTVASGGAVHRHLNATLNGGSGDPAAGVYLVPLELESSTAGVAKSMPFFLVYNSGLDEEAHDDAIDWVQTAIPLKGDMNDSGVTNNLDISHFEAALANSANYLASHPTMTAAEMTWRGDIDNNGLFNNQDIHPFEVLLATGLSPLQVPEPSTFVMLAMGALGLVLARRRVLRD